MCEFQVGQASGGKQAQEPLSAQASVQPNTPASVLLFAALWRAWTETRSRRVGWMITALTSRIHDPTDNSDHKPTQLNPTHIRRGRWVCFSTKADHLHYNCSEIYTTGKPSPPTNGDRFILCMHRRLGMCSQVNLVMATQRWLQMNAARGFSITPGLWWVTRDEYFSKYPLLKFTPKSTAYLSLLVFTT